MDDRRIRFTRHPYDISIIIVSYNSSDLLMLTLASVLRSTEGVKAEVFVVDNASTDGTPDRVRRETPWVNLIEMGTNAGFSAANNAAMKVCKGHIVLILNPDTILTRQTVRDILDHFEAHPGCGAMGLRMVNGEGRFLGESKRGYTNLATSFFKLSGIYKLFPKSGFINAYYIGNVPETGCCHAPILSGACMSFNHDTMDLAGLFDDTYFMYSEDNDLSWRMDQVSSDGNSYRGDISIIHFKGQSTPRNEKYIGYFYDSMLTFASKYEFPLHGKIVNRITAIGIRMAYYVALVRCKLLRRRESKIKYEVPVNTLIVSDKLTPILSEAEMTNYSELPNVKAQERDAIIFDIDGDMKSVIEFMRKNNGKTKFGFYNPDNGNLLVYFNNRCHKIN